VSATDEVPFELVPLAVIRLDAISAEGKELCSLGSALSYEAADSLAATSGAEIVSIARSVDPEDAGFVRVLVVFEDALHFRFTLKAGQFLADALVIRKAFLQALSFAFDQPATHDQAARLLEFYELPENPPDE
jgi:hypothetical protein